MKTLLSFVSASVLAVSFSFAQVPGIPGLSRAPVASGPQGTTLGANTTSGAVGIDLANRVKLRGYVDFKYRNVDNEGVLWGQGHDKGFGTTADVEPVGNPVIRSLTVLSLDKLVCNSAVTGEKSNRKSTSTAAENPASSSPFSFCLFSYRKST